MVRNMENHYVFKSLFEHNINHVSSIGGKAHLCTLSDTVHDFPQHISYSSWATRRLLVDNGCSRPELCNPIQCCLACRNLSIPPDVKMSSKNTLRYSSGIIVYKKRFHSKRSLLFRRTPRDDRRLQTALPSDACFTAPPTKMSAWR